MSAYSDLVGSLNPRSYWHCSDATGSTLNDTQANHSATVSGTASFQVPKLVPDHDDTAFSFTSTNGNGTLGITGISPGTDQWCFGCWMKHTSTTIGMLFGAFNSTGNFAGPTVFVNFEGTVQSAGKVFLRNNNTTAEGLVSTAGGLNNDVSRFYVFQRRLDGSQWKLEIYINGILDVSKDLSSAINLASPDTGILFSRTTASQTITGTFDEAHYFNNSALTPTQVLELFNTGIGASRGVLLSTAGITQAAQLNSNNSSTLNLSGNISSIGSIPIFDTSTLSTIASNNNPVANFDIPVSSLLNIITQNNNSNIASLNSSSLLSNIITEEVSSLVDFNSSLILSNNLISIVSSTKGLFSSLGLDTIQSTIGSVQTNFNITLNYLSSVQVSNSSNVSTNPDLTLSLNSTISSTTIKDIVASSITGLLNGLASINQVDFRSATLLSAIPSTSSNPQTNFNSSLDLGNIVNVNQIGSIPRFSDYNSSTVTLYNSLLTFTIGVNLEPNTRVIYVEGSPTIRTINIFKDG